MTPESKHGGEKTGGRAHGPFNSHLLDPGLTEKLQSLEQAKVLIEDCLFDLRKYISQIDSDPARLEELESRLSD